MESKLFQLESKNESRNDSLERSDNIENVTENQSPTEHQSAKRKFGEHLSLPRKIVKLESARQISPAMNIKASSIAGLSPLLKRTKSESYKLSPLSDEKADTFSILRKPRLIQHTTKKSDLRPMRLNSFHTLSTVAEPTTSDQQKPPPQKQQQQQLPSTSSLSSRRFNLDNRFRLGSLSKPN